ncbi:penicillin-binding protein, partial [Georgenia sp. 10Sc9-8]|nr:penicillin-binding protein [Georgenia halotolerans]
MPRLNRASWAVLAVVLAAAPLTACSEDRPDPRPAAEQLAEALQAADPGLVDWQEPASEDELTSVLVEVTDVPRDVGVASLGEQYELDGGPAVDAELAWDWDLDDGDTDWTYTTTATLVLPEDADGWVARWAPGMVAPALTGSSDTLGMEREPAQRGQILSADGTPIVTDTPVLRLGIDKARGPEDEDEARAAATGLAELVGLTDPA